MDTSLLEMPTGRLSDDENFDYTLDYLKQHNVDIDFDNAYELRGAFESIFSVTEAEKDENVLSEIACRSRQGEAINFGLGYCDSACLRYKTTTAPLGK